MSSRLRVHNDDGVIRIEFVDRNILDEANIRQIEDEIKQIIDGESTPRVIISFDNVDHLSSAALGSLITINSKVNEKGGQLRLAEIPESIYDVFVITKLERLFQIHPTCDAAMASLA